MKIAVWVALVAVVIAAVVTTVVMLAGGREVIKERKERQERRSQPVVPPPVPVDAAPAPDAAPEAEKIEVTIKTEPEGAEIAIDGIDRGKSPVTVTLVVHDHFTEVDATLAGYDDKQIQFNTYVNKDPAYTIKLKRSAKATPPPKVNKPAPEPSKVDKTGGELHGNPFSKKP